MKIIIMGVSGCGKSTLGMALANRLEWPFLEGDDYHPAANRKAMSRGIPLDDDMRQPWLDTLVQELQKHPECVLSCSALKHSYRDHLRRAGHVVFVYLQLDESEALERVQQREEHYFKSDLVKSQFATLEPPENEANVLNLDANLPTDQLVREILSALRADLPSLQQEPRPYRA